MTGQSITSKVLLVAGLCFSFGAGLWLLSSIVRPGEILPRLGFVSALICAFAVLVFCWAALLSSVARKLRWPPRARIFYLAGLSIVAPFLALFLLAAPRTRLPVFNLVCVMPVITGYLCRKMTYPELTDEEATAPEPPLSFFPK